MRKAPLFLTLCIAALANLLMTSARVSAQTTDATPRVEVGALVNELVAIGNGL